MKKLIVTLAIFGAITFTFASCHSKKKRIDGEDNTNKIVVNGDTVFAPADSTEAK
jgi:hypothetical protein